MLNEERRRAILEITNREGRVVVKDLARRFSISPVTIRIDLGRRPYTSRKFLLKYQGRVRFGTDTPPKHLGKTCRRKRRMNS